MSQQYYNVTRRVTARWGKGTKLLTAKTEELVFSPAPELFSMLPVGMTRSTKVVLVHERFR